MMNINVQNNAFFDSDTKRGLFDLKFNPFVMNVDNNRTHDWEAISRYFEIFVQNIENMCIPINLNKEWIDSEKVCELLRITKGTLPFFETFVFLQ